MAGQISRCTYEIRSGSAAMKQMDFGLNVDPSLMKWGFVMLLPAVALLGLLFVIQQTRAASALVAGDFTDEGMPLAPKAPPGASGVAMGSYGSTTQRKGVKAKSRSSKGAAAGDEPPAAAE